MKTQAARIWCFVAGVFFVVVGILGFMGRVPLPTPHHAVHLLSGVVALGLAFAAGGIFAAPFAKWFGALYTVLAIVGYLGVRDLGPIQLDLVHSATIHIVIGLTGILAGLISGAKRAEPADKSKLPTAA